MCIQTPRSLAFGGLVCFALLAAGCADHAPPLEPTPTGALLAGQGQGPQNPEVVVIDVDQEVEIPGFCAGYGDFPDGFDLLVHREGQIRLMLMRHPITGALREIAVWQGVDVTATGNDRSVSSNSAGPIILQYDVQGDPTQLQVIGLNGVYTAPGLGVILLDAGRAVFDPVTGEVVFEAGPHQDYHGDYDRLCQYLTS
ncbi:hypothetical protein BH23GEM7_BH23GEM7_30550 [soil metagenome]|nr:hypothetical protein [Gemmatimonadota bacterium]